MANLSGFMKQVKKERDRVAGQLSALDAALTAFMGVYGSKLNRKRRKMSAAARRRISRAQKARWAAWKAKHKK